MLEPDVEQIVGARLGDGERMVEFALVRSPSASSVHGAFVLHVFAMPVDMGFERPRD